MSTEQHEAFRICEEVTEYTSMTVDESNRAKVLLAEMHALIVQMAEALTALYSVAPSKAPGAGLIVGAEDKHSEALNSSRAAIAAATQYLKGPKT